jgi:outer membrane protein assembly factor BamB
VEGQVEGWGGRDRNLYMDSTLRALDYKTGKVVWNHELGEGEDTAGILTTAGHLLFVADHLNNLLALDPATGSTLWHLNVGDHVVAGPTTYQLAGRQYLLVPVGDTMYAFSLPEKTEAKK